MKSYGHYCGLAKALDAVGDRWTLLIVRELLTQGPCRYTDLRDGLPGIATNLLADRLRVMEHSGLVSREDAPPPIATTLFHLTERGRELETVLLALGRWGSPLLDHAPKKDSFRMHWLALPAKSCLKDYAPDQPGMRIELRGGGLPMAIEVENGLVRILAGPAVRPDVVITGKAQTIAALMIGKMDLAEARAAGVRIDGNGAALRRIQPRAV